MSGARRAGRWGALILCAAVLSTNCAYFNTFYHAKKYYAKAQEAQRKSRSDKLSPEAVANYDKAIEKCAKVIMQHGGGWRAGIDEALFLMGASYYGKKEYETAIKKFNELVLNFPESDHVPEALFYTGLSYHRMRNYPTATRIFARLVRDHPDFDRKDEILLTAAEGLELEFDYRGALREYGQILEESNTREVREKALERMGKIYFDEGEYDSALVAYRGLANTTRDDELYFEAQLNAGACLVRLGENGDALDIYHLILPEDAERNESGGRVWLAMAEAENRRGRHAKAIEHMDAVSKNFNNRALGIEADFRLGYTYEVSLQDYEKAREAYDQASRARGQSVFIEQAKRRLKNLKYLEELQASTDSEKADREQRASAALKVAEFSFFEGNDLTTSMNQYRAVESDFPGSDAAVRAAYARAWIYHTELDSVAEATSGFEKVIESYPASPQAERSLDYLREIGYPQDRLSELDVLLNRARAREQHRTDSLAVLASADSIVAAEAAAVAAAQKAYADSVGAVRAMVADSAVVRQVTAVADSAHAYADSLAAFTRAVRDSVAAVAWVFADSAFGLRPPVAEADTLAEMRDTSAVVSAASAEMRDTSAVVSAASAEMRDTSAVRPDSLASSPDSLPPAPAVAALPDSVLAARRAEAEAYVEGQVDLSPDVAGARAAAQAAGLWADSLRTAALIVTDSVGAIAKARSDSLIALQRARMDSLSRAREARSDSLRLARMGVAGPGPHRSVVGDSLTRVPSAAADTLAVGPQLPMMPPDSLSPSMRAAEEAEWARRDEAEEVRRQNAAADSAEAARNRAVGDSLAAARMGQREAAQRRSAQADSVAAAAAREAAADSAAADSARGDDGRQGSP